MATSPLTNDQMHQLLDAVLDVQLQLRGPGLTGWPQLGQNAQGQDLTLVDAFGAMEAKIDALTAAVAHLAGVTNAVPTIVPFPT
jgi:lysozyme